MGSGSGAEEEECGVGVTAGLGETVQGKEGTSHQPPPPQCLAFPALILTQGHCIFRAQDKAPLGPSETAHPKDVAWAPGVQSRPIPAPGLSTQASRGLGPLPCLPLLPGPASGRQSPGRAAPWEPPWGQAQVS